MTNALEGPRGKDVTLREQANSPRIGRARFIGNAVGILLLVALVVVGLAFVGLKEVPPAEAGAVMPNRWVSLAGSVLAFLCLVDLAVRRRHDRGENGADCVALLLLLELLVAASLLGLLASIPIAVVGAVAGVAGLYLLVVLAVLGGNRGANSYGPDPRLH